MWIGVSVHIDSVLIFAPILVEQAKSSPATAGRDIGESTAIGFPNPFSESRRRSTLLALLTLSGKRTSRAFERISSSVCCHRFFSFVIRFVIHELIFVF